MVSIGRPHNREARHDWWRRQIERQRNSNVTVTDFCRQLGVSAPTFYYWKRRFTPASCAAPSPTAPRQRVRHPRSSGVPVASFLPVAIREPALATRLEIELTNACVVRLQGHVDPKLLRAAIRAAGQLGGLLPGAY